MNHFLRKQLLMGKVLKGVQLSEDWLQLLEISLEYRSYNMGRITALLELPCDLGTLVVRDWETEIADEKPLDVLRNYCFVHQLVQPELRTLPGGSVSLILSEFTLFQLNDWIWLNPLKIDSLHMQERRCLIQLANGLGLDVGISEKELLRLTNQAAYELALRRGTGSGDLPPVDCLRIPAGSFGEVLRKQPLLSAWLGCPGSYLLPYHLQCPQELVWRKILWEDVFMPALVSAWTDLVEAPAYV